jgi:hypothetical protein
MHKTDNKTATKDIGANLLTNLMPINTHSPIIIKNKVPYIRKLLNASA